MRSARPARSILFTPALAIDRHPRCRQSGADISLVDLEDSVSPRRKEEARRLAPAFFAPPRPSASRLAIRINSLGQADGLADLLAVSRFPHPPDILMLPKVESPRDVEIAVAVLDGSGRREPVEVHAIIETARGVENATAVAAASPRLAALVFGAADFALSIGAERSWDALAYARSRVVTAAHAAGILAVDTAWFDVGDLDGLRDEAARAAAMGFSGKAAIHPHQVAVIHDVFTPSPASVARARRIVEIARQNGDDICVVDGMVAGIPMVAAAERLLARVGEQVNRLEGEP